MTWTGPSQWLISYRHDLTRTHTNQPSRPSRKGESAHSNQPRPTHPVLRPCCHTGEAPSLVVSPSWSGSAHGSPLHAPSDPDTGKVEEANHTHVRTYMHASIHMYINKDDVLRFSARWAYLSCSSHVFHEIIFGYRGTGPRRDGSSMDEAFTPCPREQAQVSIVWVVQCCSQVLSTCGIYVPLFRLFR